MALEDYEVALIKTMLQRGYRNRDIQFYFNTPDRPVNSGRITQIKDGSRWQDVPPAGPDELDRFLDQHPISAASGDPPIPNQIDAASGFVINSDSLIDLAADHIPPEDLENIEVIETYQELRQKAEDCLSLGHNSLGELHPRVQRFLESLPEEPSEASMVPLWMRGSQLRSIMRAHEAAPAPEEGHPARLDPLCAEYLRDLVAAFNILAAFVGKLRDLDQLSLGPDAREQVQSALNEIVPIVEDAGSVTTHDAAQALEMQVLAGATAPEGRDGERQTALAKNTAENFFLTAIRRVYWEARRRLGAEIRQVWAATKSGVYAKAGTLVLTSGAGLLWTFLNANHAGIAEFLARTSTNPVIRELLEFVVKVFS